MLKFGTVTAINPKTARARVQFADDNVTSFWLAILQKKTYKDIDTCEYVDGASFLVEENETEEQPSYFLNSKDYDKNQDLKVDEAENIDAGEF